MKIGGNEIGFLFNVRARINIAQLTETKSLDKIDDLFGGDEEKVVENVYKIARILNHEYEMKLRKDQGKSVNLTEDYAIIKRDDLDELDNFEYNEFVGEIIKVLTNQRTVETEPKKGKKVVAYLKNKTGYSKKTLFGKVKKAKKDKSKK